jgi:hypothetical protein
MVIYDVMLFVLGEMIFGVLGQTDIRGVKNITTAITEALCELGHQNGVGYLVFI